jgi:mRNA interferase RelE/StbE
MAEVRLFGDAQAQLDQLPETIRVRMRGIFERLKKYPQVSGAKPLRGDLAGQFRVRTGDYRVQFYHNKETDTVYVVQVGHRDGFYE